MILCSYTFLLYKPSSFKFRNTLYKAKKSEKSIYFSCVPADEPVMTKSKIINQNRSATTNLHLSEPTLAYINLPDAGHKDKES